GGGVEIVVADELEKRTVESVAAGFGQHVDLRRFVAEFCGIDAGLHLEFLQSIDRGQDDIRVEIGIGVDHAIEREIVKYDAVTAGRDRLVGAIAALARLRLAGRRRKVADIRRYSHQIQVLAAIERKLRDVFRLDYGADGRILRLQQSGGSLNLHAFVNLADL